MDNDLVLIPGPSRRHDEHRPAHPSAAPTGSTITLSTAAAARGTAPVDLTVVASARTSPGVFIDPVIVVTPID